MRKNSCVTRSEIIACKTTVASRLKGNLSQPKENGLPKHQERTGKNRLNFPLESGNEQANHGLEKGGSSLTRRTMAQPPFVVYLLM